MTMYDNESFENVAPADRFDNFIATGPKWLAGGVCTKEETRTYHVSGDDLVLFEVEDDERCVYLAVSIIRESGNGGQWNPTGTCYYWASEHFYLVGDDGKTLTDLDLMDDSEFPAFNEDRLMDAVNEKLDALAADDFNGD